MQSTETANLRHTKPGVKRLWNHWQQDIEGVVHARDGAVVESIAPFGECVGERALRERDPGLRFQQVARLAQRLCLVDE